MNITNIISDSNIGWVVLLGLMIFAQYFALFKALSLAKTTIIMPFFVVGVIFGNILGTIFFGETQEYIEIIGTIFVIAVNIYQIILIKLGKL
ncbi:MAG UNVERIFIED_CONTAM: hypothetical protein LVQ98_07750 [Rickettsiaceae bacterium]|jgi:uncharacterized membrane protein